MDVSPPRCLADLLQQLLVYEFKLHADGHFGDELVAALLGHLLAVSQVDMTNAPAALEIGQRLVCDPVTDCRGETGLEGNKQMVRDGSPVLT